MRLATLAIALVVCSPFVAQEKPIEFGGEVGLWEEYKKNVAAADLRITSKTVEFMARGKIDKAKDGRYVIGCFILESPNLPHLTVPGVQCYVTKDSVEKLAKASPGASFLVRGKCTGRTNEARSWGGFYVTVTECEILKVLVWDKKAKAWVEDKP